MSSEIRATSGDELRFIVDGGKPRIDARAILFNSWSVDLGNFRERMLPGSVQLEDDLIALFDHATDKVLGRTTAGTHPAPQSGRLAPRCTRRPWGAGRVAAGPQGAPGRRPTWRRGRRRRARHRQ